MHATPLHNQTEKDAPIVWSEECQESFETLKKALSSEPILALPDCAVEFGLFTDASQHRLGAILEHRNHVIAYASKVLRPAERNYSGVEKECLATVFVVEQFRHYLLGSRFTIYTDHGCRDKRSKAKLRDRRRRSWISYCPGKANKADTISRRRETRKKLTDDGQNVVSDHEDELRTARLNDPE
ncbi:hypothetical protein D918_09608 [Trichuris suis]|nr:hypothetical protein D918_09608 [Trichuris suis]